MQPMRIFGQAPVAGLDIPKKPLDDQKRMFNLGANRGFAPLNLFLPIDEVIRNLINNFHNELSEIWGGSFPSRCQKQDDPATYESRLAREGKLVESTLQLFMREADPARQGSLQVQDLSGVSPSFADDDGLRM